MRSQGESGRKPKLARLAVKGWRAGSGAACQRNKCLRAGGAVEFLFFLLTPVC